MKRRKDKARGKAGARRDATAAGTPGRASGSGRRDPAGRLHLVLVRDPATGAERLGLAAPVFKEAWQNDLAVGAANTARALVGDGPSVESTVALARSVMASVSRLAAGLLERAPEGTVACKAGCDHCCYQAVSVTLPEALAIVEHLRATLSSAAIGEVAARISAAFVRTDGLSPSERFSPEHPCPFLAGGCCSIYEVRPLSCRGMNALDAGACAERLRVPEARAAFLASGRGGRSYMEPIRAVQAVSAGLQLGLSEVFALDMRPLDLIAVMHLLLDGPPGAIDAWLEGGTPFARAVRAEAATDPMLRELSGTIDNR